MKRALRFWPLVATIYFCVSGGPYGLEPVMQGGAGMGLLLILVTPILWAVPAALMTAELASAIPVEGGYYVWVKRALGPFAGFLCGWWTWVYSWVDVAIYPGLFAKYVETLAKLMGFSVTLEGHPWLKWGIGMVIVIPLTWMNVRGIRLVGKTAVTFFVALGLPFLALVLLGLAGWLSHPSAAFRPFVAPGSKPYEAFTAGLFVVLWNYLGWDSMSTVAAEVEEPRRRFPSALGVAVPLVTVSYLLPAIVGVVALPDVSRWTEGAWTEVAQKVGGHGLATAVAVGGLISAAGLFSSTLLASSRIPFVIAEDRILPAPLTRLHSRYETPAVAILVSALFYSFFSYASFSDLAEVDVIVYSAGLLLEFAALVALRIKEPGLKRPYRVPGGWFGIALVVILPTLLLGAAIWDQLHPSGADAASQTRLTLIFSAAALLSGPVFWLVRSRRSMPTG